MAKVKLVESINCLASDAFFATYLLADTRENLANLCRQHHLDIIYRGAGDISNQLIDACLALIESTSSAAYDKSETKWSSKKKRKEMLLPDMKYVVLSEMACHGNVAGFISFMLTYEDGLEVVYVYEIHLHPQLRGRSIGTELMAAVEAIGRSIGVEKTMLTVFKSNGRAIQLYNLLGYAEDPFSPKPRVLRNGSVKQASYVILSKRPKSEPMELGVRRSRSRRRPSQC